MRLFFADVIDKEPSLVQLWAIAVVLSAAALCFARLRWWAVLGPFTLAAVWAAAVASELRDAFVGRAIFEELGTGYVVQSVIAISMPFVFGVVGLRRARANAPNEPVSS